MKNVFQVTCMCWLVLLSVFATAQPKEGVEPLILTKDLQSEFDEKYIFEIQLHTSEELMALLKKAEALLDTKDQYPSFSPIVLILHGSEIKLFERKYYAANKDLVDLAAKLDAFQIIDVRMCETRMRFEGVEKESLPAFVETVPYGPGEKTRLKNEGYIQF